MRHQNTQSEAPRARAIQAIKKHRFFHDMEIGGIRTGSWVYGDSLPPNYHLFPVFEFLADMGLAGAHCLDIGTYDGMTAFVMASLGAKAVDATCRSNLSRFRLIQSIGGWTNVRYRPETDLHDLRKDGPRTFDLICVSAMMHHLTNPMDAILLARRLLRTGGYLIVESLTRDMAGPVMLLNTDDLDPVFGTPTIWIPSPSTFKGMARLAGFEVVCTCGLTGTERGRETNYNRVTLLCRAVKPSEISERTAETAKVHEISPWPRDLDFRALESEPGELASVVYNGPVGAREINIWEHQPRVPLQPKQTAR